MNLYEEAFILIGKLKEISVYNQNFEQAAYLREIETDIFMFRMGGQSTLFPIWNFTYEKEDYFNPEFFFKKMNDISKKDTSGEMTKLIRDHKLKILNEKETE